MKTNLDGFKTNKKFEEEGIWVHVSDQVSFRVGRFGGSNSQRVQKASFIHHRPYAKQMDAGVLSPEKTKEIMIKTFVEACVFDWKGVIIDEVEAPFSKETCTQLLIENQEVAEILLEVATSSKDYREHLGNS